MSSYVISDIHGQYETFQKMLELIDFKEEDKLYVLGDVIDRGPDGIKLLIQLFKMPNVELFLGNHELLMLDALQNEDDAIRKDRKDTDDIDLWLDPCNGGSVTFQAYKELTVAEKIAISNRLKSSLIAKVVRVGKHTYHLSHSYVYSKKFKNELRYMDLKHKDVRNIVWDSIYDARFLNSVKGDLFPWKSYTYISGHVFTQRLDCIDEDGKGIIYYKNNYNGYRVYNIDCGMALCNRTSQLACLRLDDEKQFYVSYED